MGKTKQLRKGDPGYDEHREKNNLACIKSRLKKKEKEKQQKDNMIKLKEEVDAKRRRLQDLKKEAYKLQKLKEGLKQQRTQSN